MSRRALDVTYNATSYGMGGNGFFGLHLDKRGRRRDEWLLLILFAADHWLSINGQWLAANPSQYQQQRPLHGAGWAQDEAGRYIPTGEEWDNFKPLVIGKTMYDTLPGSGTEAKSRELIAYYSRRMKLGDLIEKGRELRNEIDWPTLPGDDSVLAGAPTAAGERLQSIPVHGYSGIWEAENRFTRWNGYRLGKNDKAYWHGRAFLILSFDGNHGSGSLLGKLYISISGYEATYASSGRINRAIVTENGTLHMYVEMHSRHRMSEQGEPPEAGFRKDFFGSGEYEIHLSPIQNETKVLKGKHIYRAANRVYQEAEEYFKYIGISLEAG